MKRKIIIINEKDNVAVVIADLENKEKLNIDLNGKRYEILAKQAIKPGHKIAIKNIKKGEDIIKSGEAIGYAAASIETGDHVHIHNVQSKRGGSQ